MELFKLKCKNKIYIENLLVLSTLKTGDLILFKSTDSINSFKFFNYFTHIGIVVIDKILTNNEPYLFEACPTKNMEIPENRLDTNIAKYSTGILLNPLKERLLKYRGYIYYKPLSNSITFIMKINFIDFIFYALNHMKYDYNYINNIKKKILYGNTCNDKTNCGELVFLSLIKIGLIDYDFYNKKIYHYLKWTCDITKLKKYEYNPIIEIIKVTI